MGTERFELDDDPTPPERVELDTLRQAVEDLARLWARTAHQSGLPKGMREFCASRAAALRRVVSDSRERLG